MKKYLSLFMILQLVLASLMATSHLALAGSGVHEKPHFHLLDSEHYHGNTDDSSKESEHVDEVHVHLSFIEAPSFASLIILPVKLTIADSNILIVSSLIKPLLPPPNTSI